MPKLPGQPWIPIEVDHPPLNGEPVLVCLEEKLLGSYQHVASYTMGPDGVIRCSLNPQFSSFVPLKVCFWQPLGNLPWHMGYQDPRTLRQLGTM